MTAQPSSAAPRAETGPHAWPQPRDIEALSAGEALPDAEVPTPAGVSREVLVEDLTGQMQVVAAQLNAAHARLVDLASRLLDGELWAGGGIRSLEHFLVLRAGLSPARAADVARLARRRDQLPASTQAMASGQLSMDQASVVARYAPTRFEESVTEMAVHATVPQLRRALSRYVFDVDATDADALNEPDSPHEPQGAAGRASAPAELSMTYQDDRFRLVFHAPADLGALVEQAVREAKNGLFSAGQTSATLADGLVEMANRSLSAVAGTARAGKYRVFVHLDTAGGWLGKGPALPSHLVDQLTCDGTLRPVWETEGSPVNVGRAMRIVPERTRRLVEDRDRGCRFPGCTAVGFLENHHLDHWRYGGHTTMDRLVSLCPFHHREHHRGEYTISGSPVTPGGLSFVTRQGHPVRVNVAPAGPGPGSAAAGPAPGSATPGLWPESAAAARAAPGAVPPATATITSAPAVPVPDEHRARAPARYRGPTGETLHRKWVCFDSRRPEPDPAINARDPETTR